jgi:hypothetical protein
MSLFPIMALRVIRCAAAIRPELGVKPTCHGRRSIDANDPQSECGHAVRDDKCKQPWDVQTIGDGVVQARTACVSLCTFRWCTSAASTPVVLVSRSSVSSSPPTDVSAKSV